MLLTKMKIATVVVLALVALGVGVWGADSMAAMTTTATAQPPGIKPEPEVPAAPLTATRRTTGDHAKADEEPINHIWITQKNVQEELRLTEAQVQRIQAIRQEIYKKYDDDLKKARAEAKKQNFASSREVSRKIQDEERKAFAEAAPRLLSAGALRRLQQIQRQARGLHHVIQEPAIKKKLNLNDEQLQQIEALLKEGAVKARKEFAKRHHGPVFGLLLEDHIVNERQAYADAMKKLLEVLTKEQQRTWNDLIGEPFAFKATASK